MTSSHLVFSLLVATLLICASDSQKVVIIGGGVSGLSAAGYLLRHGVQDVTILEAEDRLGGRVHTDVFHGHVIERGAQYIHGENRNQIYRLVSKRFDVRRKKYDFPSHVLYRSSGMLSNHTIKKIFFRTVTHTMADIGDRITDKNVALFLNKNVRNEARTLWEKKFRIRGDHLNRELTEAMFQYLDSLLAVIDGQFPENVGVLEDYYFEDLGSDYIIPNGYSNTVLKILANDIPASKIKLGHKVTRIHWNRMAKNQASNDGRHNESTSKQILVKYVENSGTRGEIYADHVIVTVSIGVLRNCSNTLFDPPFNVEKTKALNEMRIGTVNKVFVYYKNGFWKDNNVSYHILWDSNERDQFREDWHWIKQIYTIEVHSDQLLLLWMNTYASNAISTFTDDEVGQRLVPLLRKVFQNSTISPPDDTLVTRWHEKENFLGSYSYMPPGDSGYNRIIVGRPLSVNGIPRVLFAGEAMSRTRFSTVDGAYWTGVRKAYQILNL